MQTSLKTKAICYQKVHLYYEISFLVLKLFIEIKAFITFYSNKIRYFKGVLIEIKAFILKRNKLFMLNSLNTKPFIIKKYIFTNKAIYENQSLH